MIGPGTGRALLTEVRQHLRHVRLHTELQGVLHRERHQQAGLGVHQTAK